jgi:hypothetical protein
MFKRLRFDDRVGTSAEEFRTRARIISRSDKEQNPGYVSSPRHIWGSIPGFLSLSQFKVVMLLIIASALNFELGMEESTSTMMMYFMTA